MLANRVGNIIKKYVSVSKDILSLMSVDIIKSIEPVIWDDCKCYYMKILTIQDL